MLPIVSPDTLGGGLVLTDGERGVREDIYFLLDCSAIVLVALGLWLAFQRRSFAGVGVLLGVIGLALMSGGAAMRAYPNPTRGALHATAEGLRAEVADITGKWRE